ncbi:MAG: putative bifunctional diguanylate cyclase/phosphodiesterase [Acidimicrobiales bacterium]
MGVLALILFATAVLALERNRDLAASQAQREELANQEFALELESATQSVQSEIDRLTELMTGITAFVGVSDADPASAVDRYLLFTGAKARFNGLLDAVAHEPVPGSVLTSRPGNGSVSPELEELVGEIDSALGPDATTAPMLTSHEFQGVPVVAVTFGLDEFDAQRVSLVLEAEAFLARAMTPTPRVSTTLTNTDAPIDQGVVHHPGDPIVITRTPVGGLSSQVSVDVFGTEFQLTSMAGENLVQPTSRTQVWVILIAGGAAAFGLYAALRTLTLSRASALETARTADRERASLDRRFKASFDLAPIGMAELDSAGRLMSVNGALCHQIGLDQEAIVGRPLSSLVHEGDRPAHINRVEKLLSGALEVVQGEHRFHHQQAGTDVWVNESISVIGGDSDSTRTWLVQSQDITAQRHAAWELAQQALHDDLTGLPNRALFLNRLKHALVRADRNSTRVAVMFIDVDRFKVINDSLGHDTGDQFLVQISGRIGQAIRSGDTVARFGGDEFVVLCESVSGESEATAAAQRIQEAFEEPFNLGEGPTYATASIGITLSNEETESADSLLRDADAAMYRAKDAGRNRAELFDYSMRSTILARMEIESQLRAALDNGEIVMHYQAIVDPLSHEPAGYEALIRWNHPEKGLLGPGAFLEVAEEAGLIHLIDSFALRSTCQQIAKWVREYPVARNLYLTTNWSARHLGRFVQQVEQVLAETNIDPHQLVIEVTEGFLLEDSEGSVEALHQLKTLGVQIAIDDFGTGYSSIAYITQFEVAYLKIDRSFVSKLPEDEASAAVIGAIADMAMRLGIKLVAEGVETDEQIAMLASLGTPNLQGYRFAKPRPAADIERHLSERSGELESVVRDAETLFAMPPASS